MDLKLRPKQSYRFCLLDFNGFWRENDVTVLQANFHFPVLAQRVHDSERASFDKAKCEKNIENVQSVLNM